MLLSFYHLENGVSPDLPSLPAQDTRVVYNYFATIIFNMYLVVRFRSRAHSTLYCHKELFVEQRVIILNTVFSLIKTKTNARRNRLLYTRARACKLDRLTETGSYDEKYKNIRSSRTRPSA